MSAKDNMNLDVDGWLQLYEDDYWLFDKLILGRKLGYECGPAGMDVPRPATYCVRPVMNMFGMGIAARFEYLEKETNHLHPGEFWCEVFEGNHVSVDYLNQEPVLTVVGQRKADDPMYKWTKWTRIGDYIPFPDVLKSLRGTYPKVNCEFIGGNLIEVHLRHNPDFVYGNTVAIPVWDEESARDTEHYRFVESRDFKRIGFLIDKHCDCCTIGC